MPYGRGGAGNYGYEEQVKKENEQKGQHEDLEAQHPANSSVDPVPTSAPSQPQAYAHMGRGGAGNWYQPSELEKEGKFNQDQAEDSTAAPTSSKPQISTPWHPENHVVPVARAGRGGAGNFVWKEEDGTSMRKKGEDEEKRKEEVGKLVERSVEEGLAKPNAAVLGGAKEGRAW